MPSVLLVKMSSLGDVVHNLPVVTDIARHVPGVHIDWVVEEAMVEIPALHPAVERVIPVALRRWRRRLWAPGTWREISALRTRLRARHYDAVVDTQGLVKSAVVAALANGPTVGQDRHSAREPLAAQLYQRRFAIARDSHAVARNRELAARALNYELNSAPPDYGLRVRPNPQALAGLPMRFAVCLHGTARAAKRWPVAHWTALSRMLVEHGRVPFFSWGDIAELAQARTIAASVPEVRVPNTRLGLRDLPTLLDKADVVVGVDTGLMHLAVALGRPTVAIYVDSWPRLSGAFPSDPARAISLGGQGQLPSAGQVIDAVARLGIR